MADFPGGCNSRIRTSSRARNGKLYGSLSPARSFLWRNKKKKKTRRQSRNALVRAEDYIYYYNCFQHCSRSCLLCTCTGKIYCTLLYTYAHAHEIDVLFSLTTIKYVLLLSSYSQCAVYPVVIYIVRSD